MLIISIWIQKILLLELTIAGVIKKSAEQWTLPLHGAEHPRPPRAIGHARTSGDKWLWDVEGPDPALGPVLGAGTVLAEWPRWLSGRVVGPRVGAALAGLGLPQPAGF